jgi:hypothetical protein
MTPFMVFGTKINGEVEGYILGIKLAEPGSVEAKITVTIIVTDFSGLMFQLLLIIGGFVLIIGAMIGGYMIYLWRTRRAQLAQLHRENDIQHFEKYMPKMKLCHK